jgi:LPXTG-site transpeptidase (sortase) family protein
LLAAGVVIGGFGLALLSLFFVGAFSTSSSEAPRAVRGVAEPEHIFDRFIDTSTPEPTSAPTPDPAPPADPPLGSAPFQLVIPEIGVDAPVNTFGLDANLVPEVPLNGREVAWYEWSAAPGTGSNAVMAGHVTWSGAAVFYNLDQLGAGDEILLRSPDGAELRYTVKDNFLVDPNDPGALSVMSPTEEDVITVITCGGDYFHTGGRFGGDYTNRRVVRAALSQVTPSPQAAVSGEG